MALKIKEEFFNKIIKDIDDRKISFDAEGCACGRLEVKMSEELYMTTYRSCRKSGFTPDNKLWHIDELEFYPKSYENYDYPEEPVALKLTLDKEQKEKIYYHLKITTSETWGEEYR